MKSAVKLSEFHIKPGRFHEPNGLERSQLINGLGRSQFKTIHSDKVKWA